MQTRRAFQMLAACILLVSTGCLGTAQAQTDWTPPADGLLKSSDAAIMVASALVCAIRPVVAASCADQDLWRKNFTAELRGGIWYVVRKPPTPSTRTIGGGLLIELSQRDGRLLGLYAGQ